MFTQDQWDQLLASFLVEGRDLLQQAEEALLALDEGDDDPETVNRLFRAAHTLKGSAGLFALEAFVAFTHQQETLIMQVRDAGAAFSRAQISLLLEGLDILAAELDRLAAGEPPSELIQMHAAHYAALLAMTATADSTAADTLPSAGPGATHSVVPAAVEPPVETLPRAEPMAGQPHWHLSLRFDESLFEYGFDPASFLRYLSRLGNIVHLQVVTQGLPAWAAFQAERCYLGIELDVITSASKQQIEEVFEFIHDLSTLHILPPESQLQDYLQLIMDLPEDNQQIGTLLVQSGLLTERELQEGLSRQASDPAAGRLGEVLVEARRVPPQAVEQALQKQQQIRDHRHAETALLKVSAGKLDELINLVGELVIAAAGGELLARQQANGELLAAVSAINRHVEQIRESALRLRMVEIGETFQRFQRVVRDTSQELGKRIRLVIDGAETELDKSVVERISEPLTHLVRNALDHGLELPEERLQRGKPEQGTLRLNAYHESGSIVLEVSDDGRGLDAQRIRQKAIERGLLAEEAELDDHALYALIFEPGFSTADQVSNLSGRGVGMDVVRRNVEALRGTIELDSTPGAGCCVRIRLPLTLAIIDGFLINVGNTPLVIPLDMVTECLEAADVDQTAVYSYRELRGRPLPLINLRHHFTIPGQPSRRQNIVVVGLGRQQLGLIVDQLLGEQQIVIKPLGPLFTALRDISGSSILGSGQVALILDIPGLLQRVQKQAAAMSA